MRLRTSALAVLAAVAVIATTAGNAHATTTRNAALVRLLVKFRPGSPAATRSGLIARTGGRTAVIRDLGVSVIAVPADRARVATAQLRASSVVAYAERDGVATTLTSSSQVTPTDPYYAAWSWPFTRTLLPTAWEGGTGGNVTVAVVDSGVNAIGDLSGAMLAGYNAIDGSSNVNDDNGHGTAVSSTIAGRANNGLGSAGVCWTCSILPVKAMDASGHGLDSNISAGITWAADHGAQVINLSLGGPQSDQTLSSAVAYAEGKGVIVVAAAGNAGNTVPEYPANLPGVISVAASDQSDNRESFTTYGSWVQVAAPGCVVGQNTSAATSFSEWCGTSFSSPLVAGIAGLALSDKPTTTAAQFTQALETTADPVTQSYVAHGRVNAAATLRSLGVSLPTYQLASTHVPTITGTAVVGTTLTGANGSWTLPGNAAGTSYAYQWQRCGVSTCAPISAATATRYIVGRGDIGSTLELTVTARSAGITVAASSSPTATVALPGAPTVSTRPAVAGSSLMVGHVLTGTAARFSGATSIASTWVRCDASGASCRSIGAGGASYMLQAADVGTTIRYQSTAANLGGSTASQSDPTGAIVAAPAPAVSVQPSISGSPVAGQKLTGGNGTWSGTASFRMQWYRCTSSCTPIPGSTAASYTLTAADAGKTFKFCVTGTGLGGSAQALSAATAAVTLPAAPANTVAPAVTGGTTVPAAVSGTLGTWTAASGSYTTARRWLRCAADGTGCVPIDGAGGTSYALRPADAGATLREQVTATGLGGSTTVQSAATAAIHAAAAPSTSADPSIHGTATQGQGLTGSTPSWLNASSLTDQWLRCTSSTDASTCTPIGGRTTVSYAVSSADVGDYLEFRVTATGFGGTVARTSAATALVTVGPAPTASGMPTISGTPAVGSTLNAGALPSWTNASSVTYQWLRCTSTDVSSCTAIAGATSTHYIVLGAMHGVYVRFEAIGTSVNGLRTAAVSDATTQLP